MPLLGSLCQLMLLSGWHPDPPGGKCIQAGVDSSQLSLIRCQPTACVQSLRRVENVLSSNSPFQRGREGPESIPSLGALPPDTPQVLLLPVIHSISRSPMLKEWPSPYDPELPHLYSRHRYNVSFPSRCNNAVKTMMMDSINN
jgi:hypothetical protein